jgi:WD40 repeat protein
VAFSPDGRQLLSGGDAYALRLWNAGDGTLIRSFEGHRGNVHAVGFAADARSIVSGSADRTLRVWDAVGGRMVAAFMNGPDAWASIAPDGSFVASDEAEGFFAIVRGNELLPTDEFIRRKRQDHLDVRIAAGR